MYGEVLDLLHQATREGLPHESAAWEMELRIMDVLWMHGASSVREIQEASPEKRRPAYTTVQTMVYRLEAKRAIRRVKKIGNAHIFEAAISRSAAQRRLVDDLLSFFGGRPQPVMAHLIESGRLTLADVQEAEKTLRKLARGARTHREESEASPAAARASASGRVRHASASLVEARSDHTRAEAASSRAVKSAGGPREESESSSAGSASTKRG